jgi:phosphoribosylamine--glycine ligase
MKVLVIGSGGREHAMVWKLAQSKHVEKIFCAPGNAGISQMAECIDKKPTDFDALLDFVKHEWVDLTVVGPEDPLARGIVDADFMKRWGIPTAEYKTFSSYMQAEDYVRMKGTPIVVKADGLAAGKGVIVCNTHEEAMEALGLIMKEKAFGDAGSKVVVEECLVGEEASYMAFVDGRTILPMVSSQDHKAVFDGDEGPNTGGMGAYSPAPVVTPEMEAKIMSRVMVPTLKGLQRDGIKYKGILYAGIMIKGGEPYVLEFNCRMGDPETQPILQRLDTDFVDVCIAIADEKLSDISLKWKPETSVCVVMASGGYPGSYEKGKPIKGLEDAAKLPDTVVFHAGTAFNDGEIVTAGGRVLGVTALGADIKDAKKRAYEAVGKISFEGAHFRRDISDKALKRLE